MMNNAKEFEPVARAYLSNAGLTDDEVQALENIGYFTAPASMRHHLNCVGGLMQHSANVARKMLGFKVFDDPASNYRVGMLHDVCKCLCYREKKGGGGFSWVDSGYPGHGVASCLILADIGIKLKPSERAAILWHMGCFGMSEDDSKAYHADCIHFPREIILTHACDHLASIYEARGARIQRLPNALNDGDYDEAK